MPHFKCVTCRTRLHDRVGVLADDVCPDCGSAYEPVAELTELVGFRAITAERRLEDGGIAAVEAVALPRPDTTC